MDILLIYDQVYFNISRQIIHHKNSITDVYFIILTSPGDIEAFHTGLSK